MLPQVSRDGGKKAERVESFRIKAMNFVREPRWVFIPRDMSVTPTVIF